MTTQPQTPENLTDEALIDRARVCRGAYMALQCAEGRAWTAEATARREVETECLAVWAEMARRKLTLD